MQREILAEALQDEGYAVDPVSDGAELLHHAVNGGHAVILMDLRMPRLTEDVLAVLPVLLGQRLRCLIVLSAWPNGLLRCEELGYPHVLSKPFDLDTLCELVRNVANECHEPQSLAGRTTPSLA